MFKAKKAKSVLASTVAILVVCGSLCTSGLVAFAEPSTTSEDSTSYAADTDTPVSVAPPYSTNGDLFHSKDNDFISYEGGTGILTFKKSGFYELVYFDGVFNRVTGEYTDIKFTSLFDGKVYGSWDEVVNSDSFTEFEADSTFGLGTTRNYLLVYKASEDSEVEAYRVCADVSTPVAGGNISCSNTGNNTDISREFKFDVEFWGGNLLAIVFKRDGTEVDRITCGSGWGSPCSVTKSFYANGNYTAVAVVSGVNPACECSFTIEGLPNDMVVPVDNTEDTTPPAISYTVNPSSSNLALGEEVTVTIMTDEPTRIQFNGMQSDDWVTSWDFPVYINGTWKCVVADKSNNGNSCDITITNFGDGTTDYTESDNGNPLDSYDPDNFWEDVESEGVYNKDGDEVTNTLLRDTHNGRNAKGFNSRDTLPQTGMRVWRFGIGALLLAGGVLILTKIGIIGKKSDSTEEETEEYTPVVEPEDTTPPRERDILDEIFGDDTCNYSEEDSADERK